MANNGQNDRFFSAEVLFVACERGTISALICCGGRIFCRVTSLKRGRVVFEGDSFPAGVS